MYISTFYRGLQVISWLLVVHPSHEFNYQSWKADTWAAMLWRDSEIFGMIKCCMSPPALEGILANGPKWIDSGSLGDGRLGCMDFFGLGGEASVVALGGLDDTGITTVGVIELLFYLISWNVLLDKASGSITQIPLVEPWVVSPSEPWHTKHPNPGQGGMASQLRKAGEAVIDAPARHTGKG
ncbi:hypothetical protein F4604DRAFT_1682418 [Suillus subluteus]|nr:hypothetical protein F4604DRAFT_1682418 [Suillus subluteus]